MTSGLRRELVLNEMHVCEHSGVCQNQCFFFFAETELRAAKLVDVYRRLEHVTVNLQGWLIKATVT